MTWIAVDAPAIIVGNKLITYAKSTLDIHLSIQTKSKINILKSAEADFTILIFQKKFEDTLHNYKVVWNQVMMALISTLSAETPSRRIRKTILVPAWQFLDVPRDTSVVDGVWLELAHKPTAHSAGLSASVSRLASP